MAVVYFTSNASTGAGSLVEAIQNAAPGDVVRPDETVFERGATIEIALASTLTIDKNLTLDGGSCRVAVDGGSVVRCAFVASGSTASFTSFDFVGGATSSSGGGIYVEASSTLVLTRCRVAGCSAGNGGGGIYSLGDVALNDCVVTGCVAMAANGGGISAAGALVLDGSTVVGNITGAPGSDVRATATLAASNSILGDASTDSATAPDYRGCVVGVASSSVGFVASPPDDLTVDNWSANAWQNWDLRLLDDASGAPSPYRDSGVVGEKSQYDLQGNFRGRETNGVATCSPGAYETIQAEFFWIGEPFPQELVDLAPQNLVVSDFIETSETRASAIVSWTRPENANYSAINWEYKTNENPPDFTAIAPLNGKLTSRTTTIVIGRIYTIRIRGQLADGSYTAWSVVEFPADASLNDATGGGQTTWTMLPSPLNVVDPSFGASDGWAASRFATVSGDASPQAGQTLFVDGVVAFNDAPPVAVALVVGADNVVIPGADNVYLTIGATRSATVGGTLAALKIGDYTELTSLTSLEIPAVEFGGANVVVDNVSVEFNDGVIFAAAPRPAAITTTGSGGWADTTVGVSALDVSATDAQTVAVSIVKNDANKAAFAQYSTDDGASWQTVATTADVDEYSLTVPQGADVTVRVAIATGWLSETVSTATFLPVWTVSNGRETVSGVSNVFEVATGGSNDGLNTYDFNNYGYL